MSCESMPIKALLWRRTIYNLTGPLLCGLVFILDIG